MLIVKKVGENAYSYGVIFLLFCFFSNKHKLYLRQDSKLNFTSKTRSLYYTTDNSIVERLIILVHKLFL